MSYAIVAGLCAAGAGFFGKLPSYSDRQQFIYPWMWVLICIGFVISLNVIMWTFYTKALHQRGGTVVATAVSSGTNYFFSAILGSVVFGEKTSLVWWLGMLLVVVGLFLINNDSLKEKKEI